MSRTTSRTHRRTASHDLAEPETTVLTKAEIDRRIDAVVAEWPIDTDAREGAPLAVRWIRPAELIARVAPFLSDN